MLILIAEVLVHIVRNNTNKLFKEFGCAIFFERIIIQNQEFYVSSGKRLIKKLINFVMIGFREDASISIRLN